MFRKPKETNLVFSRCNLLKIVLIIAMISGLVLSSKLWLSSRLYPQVPVFPFLHPIPFPLDYFFFFLLFLVLGFCLFKASAQKYFFVFISISLFLILFDQSRLQPWIYQYLLMFAIFAFYSWKEKQAVIINTCCFIVATLYIYSGLQKLNPAFTTTVFPWLMEPIVKLMPKELSFGLLSLGTIVPYVEIGIGIGLLTRRFRQSAVVIAISMHMFILYTLIWHNWNSAVWPWNIAMCCFVLVLFWDNQTIQWTSLLSLKTPVSLFIIFLCGIMPLFSFFHLWDAYLSASLYSGNTQTAQLDIQKSAFSHLDPRFEQYITPTDTSYEIIDVNSWSLIELNVPAYPETRIFKAIAKSVCRQVATSDAITLRINEKPDWNTGEITTSYYSCGQL